MEVGRCFGLYLLPAAGAAPPPKTEMDEMAVPVAVLRATGLTAVHARLARGFPGRATPVGSGGRLGLPLIMAVAGAALVKLVIQTDKHSAAMAYLRASQGPRFNAVAVAVVVAEVTCPATLAQGVAVKEASCLPPRERQTQAVAAAVRAGASMGIATVVVQRLMAAQASLSYAIYVRPVIRRQLPQRRRQLPLRQRQQLPLRRRLRQRPLCRVGLPEEIRIGIV